MRLVVRRERTVPEPLGDVEPTLTVRLHDERVVAADGVRAFGSVRRLVPGRFRLVVIRDVETRPLLLALVPPDELLPLRPGHAVEICRGAVVEDPAVRRPRPGPFVGHVA